MPKDAAGPATVSLPMLQWAALAGRLGRGAVTRVGGARSARSVADTGTDSNKCSNINNHIFHKR